MKASRLRRIAGWVRRTPLHPQWLLGSRNHDAMRVAALARGRVLDIGCADRWIEPHLPPGCEYIGLDYPATGDRLYRARPDVFADACRLPLIDGEVDTVVMLEVLEHVRHPQRALEEVARVLAPGGRLLLTIPFLYPVHDAPHDYQRLTTHGLVRDLEAAGLRIEVVATSMGAAETAALTACLALAGMSLESIEGRRPSIAWLPLVLPAILAINLGGWLCARMLPPWSALTAGYWAQAIKP